VFAGFHPAFLAPPYGQINASVRWLEVLVVLINAGIAWLMLRDKPSPGVSRWMGLQNATLLFTGVNLVLVLLFPPFESVFAITKAALPTFEGFYFIINQKPSHLIVISLLYIEVIFILSNGALLWLLFKPKTPDERAAEQMRAFAAGPTRK
jgi:L-asparagine transporter-like permease